jgi:hypothetical protein
VTLIVSWVAVDPHGTASAYIAADSRISWPGKHVFDHGRKVFAFRNSPDILGYCGDVLFPSIVLGQIVEMADAGLLFDSEASSKQRFEAIKEKLVQQFHKYPLMEAEITADTLKVLHISRDPIDNLSFSCWTISWRRANGWSGEERSLPGRSDVLEVLGSGACEFRTNMDRYQKSGNPGTSRNVFHCFCDTLRNIKDNRCGGSPQLVGLYRKPDSSGISYGVITNKKRFFLGAGVDDVAVAGTEWRNDLFERCDGGTMKKLDDAQSQPDVLRRKKRGNSLGSR